MNFPSKYTLALIFFFSIVLQPAVQAAENRMIQIKGSDTMVNLGQSWAEEFMQKRPEVRIAVTGGGSGTGITAIISGTCDIAQSSRDITPEELAKGKSQGNPIQITKVAHDGIAVTVHPGNPVSQLTVEQLSNIFSGKTKNWKEVGGKDLPILVLSRERNSGTHVFFLEHIVRQGHAKGPEEFVSSALMMPSSQSIVEQVQTSEAAIAYIGLGYVTSGQKVIAVAKAAGAPYVLPKIETVLNSEYPISRALYFLTRGEPKGTVKDFIDYVLGNEGQEVVRSLDFVPVK